MRLQCLAALLCLSAMSGVRGTCDYVPGGQFTTIVLVKSTTVSASIFDNSNTQVYYAATPYPVANWTNSQPGSGMLSLLQDAKTCWEGLHNSSNTMSWAGWHAVGDGTVRNLDADLQVHFRLQTESFAPDVSNFGGIYTTMPANEQALSLWSALKHTHTPSDSTMGPVIHIAPEAMYIAHSAPYNTTDQATGVYVSGQHMYVEAEGHPGAGVDFLYRCTIDKLRSDPTGGNSISHPCTNDAGTYQWSDGTSSETISIVAAPNATSCLQLVTDCGTKYLGPPRPWQFVAGPWPFVAGPWQFVTAGAAWQSWPGSSTITQSNAEARMTQLLAQTVASSSGQAPSQAFEVAVVRFAMAHMSISELVPVQPPSPEALGPYLRTVVDTTVSTGSTDTFPDVAYVIVAHVTDNPVPTNAAAFSYDPRSDSPVQYTMIANHSYHAGQGTTDSTGLSTVLSSVKQSIPVDRLSSAPLFIYYDRADGYLDSKARADISGSGLMFDGREFQELVRPAGAANIAALAWVAADAMALQPSIDPTVLLETGSWDIANVVFAPQGGVLDHSESFNVDGHEYTLFSPPSDPTGYHLHTSDSAFTQSGCIQDTSKTYAYNSTQCDLYVQSQSPRLCDRGVCMGGDWQSTRLYVPKLPSSAKYVVGEQGSTILRRLMNSPTATSCTLTSVRTALAGVADVYWQDSALPDRHEYFGIHILVHQATSMGVPLDSTLHFSPSMAVPVWLQGAAAISLAKFRQRWGDSSIYSPTTLSLERLPHTQSDPANHVVKVGLVFSGSLWETASSSYAVNQICTGLVCSPSESGVVQQTSTSSFTIRFPRSSGNHQVGIEVVPSSMTSWGGNRVTVAGPLNVSVDFDPPTGTVCSTYVGPLPTIGRLVFCGSQLKLVTSFSESVSMQNALLYGSVNRGTANIAAVPTNPTNTEFTMQVPVDSLTVGVSGQILPSVDLVEDLQGNVGNSSTIASSCSNDASHAFVRRCWAQTTSLTGVSIPMRTFFNVSLQQAQADCIRHFNDHFVVGHGGLTSSEVLRGTCGLGVSGSFSSFSCYRILSCGTTGPTTVPSDYVVDLTGAVDPVVPGNSTVVPSPLPVAQTWTDNATVTLGFNTVLSADQRAVVLNNDVFKTLLLQVLTGANYLVDGVVTIGSTVLTDSTRFEMSISMVSGAEANSVTIRRRLNELSTTASVPFLADLNNEFRNRNFIASATSSTGVTMPSFTNVSSSGYQIPPAYAAYTSTPTPTPGDDSDDGLSGAAIAGIVLISLMAVSVAALGARYYHQKGKYANMNGKQRSNVDTKEDDYGL